MRKKILSFMLTIAMIFGVLPLGLTVSAAEPEPLNHYTNDKAPRTACQKAERGALF